jgi:predicted nicotinamide N-methyase
MELAGVPLERVDLTLGPLDVSLWRAVGLERFVDVAALLGGATPPEPPYWMHLWPGALALARRLAQAPEAGQGMRVLELGCGLGLPALAAAGRGARVVACDWRREPLMVMAQSAADNGVAVGCVQMDWNAPALRGGFDLCLGADIGYDPAAAPALAAALVGVLRPGGAAWLADSVNTARTALADELARRGFAVGVREVRELEEGRVVWVRIIEARRA